MHVELRPLPGAFGVELCGVDLHDEQPGELRRTVRDAWLEHSLVLVRGQDLDTDEHKRFVEWFGPISTAGYAAASDRSEKYISNTRDEGVAREGSLLKHQDFCFHESLLPGLSLYAEEVPSSGGETVFASTQLAYQRLPDGLRQRIGALHARHVYDYSNDRGTQRFRIAAAPQAPTASHPVVLAHPATDRPLLFVNELMTDSIVELTDRESEELLHELWSYLDDDAVRYEHRWEVRDLIVWDNLALQHGRRDFPEGARRSLRRFQIGA
ncbi:MAG TPA: TauD/TfdA family dioxygenase [Acidimicrobiales bacterium]|nr:TauD/TfdA family dioxygenase [Acidimicrobiales bacterium]